jgi:hypothetical protein
MRIALHAVHAEDYPEFHNAMLRILRGSRLADYRFITTERSFIEADDLLPPLAEFTARPRTGDEVRDMLAALIGEPGQKAWWALRTFAPLHHVPAGGSWSFGPASAYVAAEPKSAPASSAASVRHLFRRYLEGFGPASVQDFAQFAFLRRQEIQPALRDLDGEIDTLDGPNGATLYDLPGSPPLPAEDVTAPPRLLSMWDSILLGYADRSRVVPPDYRQIVCRRNGDVLPTLLVDGYVAGVWRPVEGGVEATAFHRLDDAAWQGLAVEAAALVTFLKDREPDVYQRYAHWWSKKMPRAEVRVLPG